MSPRERRDAKNARILIGREDQQDLFMRSLLQPEHRESKLIFSISGQGGVGYAATSTCRLRDANNAESLHLANMFIK